jgi:hypothetical protein
MAFGQIDPARLNGEALRQWYLRSPAEIEDERRHASARAYDAFFSQPDDPQSDDGVQPRSAPAAPIATPLSDADLTWRQIGPTLLRSDGAAAGSTHTSANGYQLAAAALPAWGYWPGMGCVNCHGPRPGMPPAINPTPRPPMFSPRDGGSGGSGASSRRGDWSDKPQCDQQFEMDREICQQAHHPDCWVNQLRRLQHCEQTGEVNTPGLGFGPRGRR